MLYLTPERYRAMGYGAEDVDDTVLRAILNRASRTADRYCAAPAYPQRHSFRGGTITGEKHDFRTGNGVTEGVQKIVWPYHTPLLSCTRFRIYVTNTQYVSFDPADIFVRPDSLEIVSLAMTSNGLFGAAITPVLGLLVPQVEIDYTYGYEHAEVDDVCTPTDARTYRASNQFWSDGDVTVKVDGVEQTSGFTLDREEGTILFDTMQAPEAEVTVSYSYTLPSDIPEAVGIIATKLLADRAIAAGGMTGLRSLKVGEISMERAMPRREEAALEAVPPEAAVLLDPFRFLTVR